MLLFALEAVHDLGAAIADRLGMPLGAHEALVFEDGERKTRPLVDPGGEDVYVVQSLHGGPVVSGDEKLVQLLQFVAALRDHGARRVTAIVPYLTYARQDRRIRPFDPVALRVMGQLFEAVGTDVLVTLDVHNAAAFDNALRLRAVDLDPGELFAAAAERLVGPEPLAVASPDVGGIKRAQLWREQLERRWRRPIGQAFVDKRRADGVIGGSAVVTGSVEGATVLLRDDLIATFGTIARATEALLATGARRVLAFASHGLFAGSAAGSLLGSRLEHLVVTDSVPPFRLASSPALDRIEVVSTADLFSAAIRRLRETDRR